MVGENPKKNQPNVFVERDHALTMSMYKGILTISSQDAIRMASIGCQQSIFKFSGL